MQMPITKFREETRNTRAIGMFIFPASVEAACYDFSSLVIGESNLK